MKRELSFVWRTLVWCIGIPLPLIGQSWVKTQGPYGGSIRTICSTKNGTLYVGADGGLFRSTDKGGSWSQVQFTTSYFNLIQEVFATDDGIIFVRTDSEDGKYLSSDHGKTWPYSYKLRDFNSMIADSNGVLYIATNNQGIVSSTDKGQTLTPLLPGTKSGGSLFYSKLHRLYHLTTDGLYEIPLSPSPSMRRLDTTRFTLFAEGKPGEFLAGIKFKLLAYSNDSGRTWKRWSTDSLFGQYSYFEALGISPQGELYAGAFYDIYRSTDKGATWSGRHWSYEGIILTFHRSRQGDFFLGTLGYGVYRYDQSAATWIPINQGINAARPWHVIVNSKGTVFTIVGDRIWRSRDKGLSWSPLPIRFEFRPPLACDSKDVLYARYYTALYSSTDEGETWDQRPYPVGPLGDNLLLINARDEVIVQVSARLWKSADRGASWTPLGATLGRILLEDAHVAKNGDLFVVGTDYYASPSLSAAWRSTDHGASWHELRRGYFSSVATNISGDIFITQWSTPTYFRSNDNGVTWSEKSFPGWISIGPRRIRSTSGKVMIADREFQMMISRDQGNTWEFFDGGKELSFVSYLTVGRDGYAYVGTQDHGLYRSSEPLMRLPLTTRFLGSYPNPFNGRTSVEFELSEPQFTELRVYDLLGRLIETLVAEYLGAGVHVYSWQPRQIASGVYLARLKTGNSSATAKLLYVR